MNYKCVDTCGLQINDADSTVAVLSYFTDERVHGQEDVWGPTEYHSHCHDIGPIEMFWVCYNIEMVGQ